MDYEIINKMALQGVELPGQVSSDFSLGGFFTNIFFWAGIVAVVSIMIAGVLYMTAAGNPDGIKKAKMTIIYTIVGLVIIIFSYGIIKFVMDLLG